MLAFPERVADVLARRLLAWLRLRVEPGSREWLDALTAESECAGSGWQRLRWALGGVPLVWSINNRRAANEPARGTMRAVCAPVVANTVAIAGWYAVTVPAIYAATRFFGCHLSLGGQPGGCQEHPLVFGSIAIGSGVLGMIIALALRARFAAHWWAAMCVFNVVGSVWYIGSGIIDLPRYEATRSAMLMAAIFGVVLAAIMRNVAWTETGRDPPHRAGGRAEAHASLLGRHRIGAHLIAGTISFALADLFGRMRDAYPRADNVNHYAVLGSAMFAAILTGVIGRHGGEFRPRALSFRSD